jgi:3-oxoacyl-[acyl-carrier-protein] synthase II
MYKYIVMEGIGSVSALGISEPTLLNTLGNTQAPYQVKKINHESYPVFPLHPEAEEEIEKLLAQYPKYKRVDRTVHLALVSVEKCLSQVNQPENYEWTINAGSSRGATGVWENFFTKFLKEQRVPAKSSPLTTLGNISTHIAQHQKIQGFQIDHSITCSSGLQALANAFAWLRSGMVNHFLAIGTESPLTDFTITQMAVLGIYTSQLNAFPCQPCATNQNKTNSFALGEAAVSVALVNKETLKKGDLYLSGMGTGSEVISNPTSISPEGMAFKISMKKAMSMAGLQPTEIDIIITHSPGTYQGDQAEFNAITTVFGTQIPYCINHKFLTGHTLGASGLLSLDLAARLLKGAAPLYFPYPSMYLTSAKKQPKHALINSMGFGGNAVSIILSLA